MKLKVLDVDKIWFPMSPMVDSGKVCVLIPENRKLEKAMREAQKNKQPLYLRVVPKNQIKNG